MNQRGTIVQKPNGRHYVATHYTDASGRKRQRSHGGYPTKREAQKALTDALSKLDNGTAVEASQDTLGSYLVDEWLPGQKAHVRPSTFDSYERTIDLHVMPKLGGIKVQALTAARLTAYYADLATTGKKSRKKDGLPSGLSVKTIRNVHTILHKALSDAQDQQRVATNVAAKAKPPKLSAAPRKQMKTWTKEEARAFLQHVATDRLFAAWHLATHTGMRRGELLGVRWQDLDLDQARLSIRQTIVSVAYEVQTSDTKTTKGTRMLDLDPATVRHLRKHHANQSEERLALGVNYHDAGLVFAREDGTPIHPDRFTQLFDKHVKNAKVPRIRLHDVRHTFATLALGAGVPVKVVSEILGHASSAFTADVYQHVTPMMQADATSKVAALISDASDDRFPSSSMESGMESENAEGPEASAYRA